MVKKVSEVPEGIKILAFLFFVGAVVSLMMGAFMFGFSDGVRNMDPSMLATSNLGEVNPLVLIFVGIFLIAVGVFEYFLGRGLLMASRWSKIALGIFSFLGIILSMGNLRDSMYASGLFGILSNGFVIWYIFFNKKLNNFFK